MYATCLFCTGALGTNERIEHFPVGRRLAFDASKGRLWVVCARCGQWNLTPIEERWEAIEECERLFRDTFVRVSTDNIGLARLTDGLELIRIGAPLRPELAAWRYGRFGARRRRMHYLAGAGLAAGAVGAAAFAATIGPALAMGPFWILVVPAMATITGASPAIGAWAANEYIVHDRVVARFAHDGRVITVRAKNLNDIELSLHGHQGEPSLIVLHDNGWSELSGGAAMHATGVLIAGANRFGGDAAKVSDAVRQIELAGDAEGYMSEVSDRNRWRGGRVMSMLNEIRRLGVMQLSATERLALEMAVHEESERRVIEGELATLEEAWRAAEEIAAISDVDLTPPKLYE